MFCPKWVLQVEIPALRKMAVEYLPFQLGLFASPHYSESQKCW